LGATPDPVRIRIDYFLGVEETEAVYIGPNPDAAGELFRVSRPSICMAGVAREDVVWLEPNDDLYTCFGVIERSSWETHWLLLPREALNSLEAYDDFKQAVSDAGCIFEGDGLDGQEARAVISVPAGVTADGWTSAYDRLIQRTAGLSPQALLARVVDDKKRRDSARREQEQRRARALRRLETLANITVTTIPVLIGLVSFAAAGWWIYALVAADALTKPKIAALGMIIPVVPSVIVSIFERSGLRLTLGAAAAGVVAFLLAGRLTNPAYVFPAVALGLLFAGAAGLTVAFFVMAGLLTESSRGRWRGWFFFGVACLVSSIAAVVYAVTAAHANNGQFDAAHIAAQTIPFGGILLTVEILRTPLRRRTLGSIGRAVVELAVVWVLVWLFVWRR
jgi:hypothetical protein